MKVIIVGIGRVGTILVEELCKEGHSIVAIDRNGDLLQECINKFDIQGICGNGCNADVLLEADVDKCDMLVSVMPQDENNILCCMVARVLGAKHLVARVRDPEYFEQFEFLREKLGISMLVNPEHLAAHEILHVLQFPAAKQIHSFSGGKVEVVEFKLPRGCKLDGLSLVELRKKLKIPALVVAVERDDTIIIPHGNIVLRGGDIVSVCACHFDLRTFFRTFGIFKQKAQSVMLLGGGAGVFYLARELEENGFFVKIISTTYERCLKMKGGLKKANVVCGDYTDRDVLEREGIDDMDAVVSVSHYDENNIVTSLFAKSRGVEKAITLLRGNSYRGILEEVQLDTPVSPYRLAAAQLARYLRAIDVEQGGGVKAMYKIADDRVEVLLFNVSGNEAFSGKPLKELDLEKEVLIAAVIRGKYAYIPDGNFVLGDNDDLVVIAADEKIYNLEDILRS